MCQGHRCIRADQSICRSLSSPLSKELSEKEHSDREKGRRGVDDFLDLFQINLDLAETYERTKESMVNAVRVNAGFVLPYLDLASHRTGGHVDSRRAQSGHPRADGLRLLP